MEPAVPVVPKESLSPTPEELIADSRLFPDPEAHTGEESKYFNGFSFEYSGFPIL